MTEDEKAEHKLGKMFEYAELLTEYCKINDLRDSETWLIQNSKVLNEESAGICQTYLWCHFGMFY